MEIFFGEYLCSKCYYNNYIYIFLNRSLQNHYICRLAVQSYLP